MPAYLCAREFCLCALTVVNGKSVDMSRTGSFESLKCNTRKHIKQQCIPDYQVLFQRVNNTFSILELKCEWLTGIGQSWRGIWASLIYSINLQNKPRWHWKHSLATEFFEFLETYRASLNLSVNHSTLASPTTFPALSSFNTEVLWNGTTAIFSCLSGP